MDVINAWLDRSRLASLLVVIVAVVGGVVVVVNPETLSFEDYLRNVGIFAGGVGVLGIARAQSGKGTEPIKSKGVGGRA